MPLTIPSMNPASIHFQMTTVDSQESLFPTATPKVSDGTPGELCLAGPGLALPVEYRG